MAGDEALRADRVRQECEHCRTWWQEELETESARAVGEGVTAAIRDFQPPRETRSRQWDYVAAAAVVVLVVGTMLFSPSHREVRLGSGPLLPFEDHDQAASGLILSEGFEEESSLTPIMGDAAEPNLEADLGMPRDGASEGGETIFTDDLEEGGFDGWSQHS